MVDLTAHLGLAQSTVSKHLACLKDCGLVSSRPEGRASMWSLNHLDTVMDLLASAEKLLALTGDAVTLTPPLVGIVLAAVSLAVMPFLSWAQRRTGRALGSNAVVADSTQTLLCTYLSAVLLVGLVLNATLGWSWADPIAGLVIAAGSACGSASSVDDLVSPEGRPTLTLQSRVDQ